MPIKPEAHPATEAETAVMQERFDESLAASNPRPSGTPPSVPGPPDPPEGIYPAHGGLSTPAMRARQAKLPETPEPEPTHEVGLLIKCDKCLELLREQGGLLFGPPGESGHPVKLHVCVDCWVDVLAAIDPEELT